MVAVSHFLIPQDLRNLLLIYLAVIPFTLLSQQPQEKWVALLGGAGTEDPQTICSDDSGNVYVCSRYNSTITICNMVLPTVIQQTVSGNGNGNVIITKLNSSGTCVWNVVGISKIGLNNASVQLPEITDMKYLNGNIYLCGLFYDSLLFQNTRMGGAPFQYMIPFVMKINSSGVVQWGKTFHAPTGRAHALALTSQGLYVSGTYGDSISFGNFKLKTPVFNSFLIGMNHNGSYNWAKNLAPGLLEVIDDMCFDGNKNLYIAGTRLDSATARTALIKLDTNGNSVWVHSGTAKTGGIMSYQKLAYSNTGDVYLTGMFNDSIRWGPSTYTVPPNVLGNVLVKISAAGQLQWSKHIVRKSFPGGTLETNKRGPLLYTGFTDTLIFGTQTYISSGNVDNALLQYDHAGNLLWKIIFGGTSQEITRDVHCNNGSIYFTCYSMSSYTIGNLNVTNSGSGDIVVAKLFDELATSIYEESKTTRTFVYPNPATDLIHIASTGAIKEVIVRDQLGREVVRVADYRTLKVTDFQNGIYFFTIAFEHNFLDVKKVVIDR